MQRHIAACVCFGTAASAAAWYWFAVQAAGRSGQQEQQQRQRTAEDEDVPDDFKDPITYEIINDPVVLRATGQVYEYQSLRRWLAAGNYRCPRTNLELVDAQVCRLPWLKQSIRDWLQQHGRQLPAEASCCLADIEATQPEVAAAIRTMRNDSGRDRLTATTLLAYQYRRWHDSTPDDAAAQMAQAEVRSAVLDDLLWIIRYATGEPQLQGAAASLLACCCLDEELAWLAATAVVPLVAMLNSAHSYAQEWALQVVYKVCLHVHSSRQLLWKAGAVQALLQLVSRDKAAVGFHRDRAAVALATLAEAAEVKAWLKEHANGIFRGRWISRMRA
ncbi:hypothetical protein OEZ86_010899 [Tetradesmus obliquus]|nr:hypothetical protein OEZ86_010899 [Tetradesmus obliquus]